MYSFQNNLAKAMIHIKIDIIDYNYQLYDITY